MAPTECGPRLLIVEDDGPIGQLLLELLSDECGWRTTLVTSVTEARAIIGAVDFDLMFVDYGLPDGNGLELARWAHTMPGPHHPLACLVSALDREVLVREAMREGVVHRFLAKPFDLDEIVSTVRGVKLSGPSAIACKRNQSNFIH